MQEIMLAFEFISQRISFKNTYIILSINTLLLTSLFQEKILLWSRISCTYSPPTLSPISFSKACLEGHLLIHWKNRKRHYHNTNAKREEIPRKKESPQNDQVLIRRKTLISKTSSKGWQHAISCREPKGIPGETRLYGKYTRAGYNSKNDWVIKSTRMRFTRFCCACKKVTEVGHAGLL